MLPLCASLAILLAISSQTPAAAQSPTKRSKKKNEPATAPAARPVLQPNLVPGQVMRYQVEFKTTSDTKPGGAVQDPEGPTHVVIVWDAKIRLEVLGLADSGSSPSAAAPDGKNATAQNAAAQPAAAANLLRLRTTYEQSTATVQSDTPDPQSEAIVKQYQQLEGRTIEFAIDARGNVTSVSGLEGILTDASTIQAAQQWMSQLSAGSSAPAGGLAPGVTWSSEQSADSLPLAGLTWRTDSTYLRDDPCRPALPADTAARQPDDTCAVILMSLTLSPSRTKVDPTPEQFRLNGLQSSGHWTGSGDSLSYVSLRTGWVVSASQTSTQEMDVDITTALGATVHYGGTMQTHSQISLLPPEARPASQPSQPQPVPQAQPTTPESSSAR